MAVVILAEREPQNRILRLGQRGVRRTELPQTLLDQVLQLRRKISPENVGAVEARQMDSAPIAFASLRHARRPTSATRQRIAQQLDCFGVCGFSRIHRLARRETR